MNRLTKILVAAVVTFTFYSYSTAEVYPLLVPQGYEKSNLSFISSDLGSENMVGQILFPSSGNLGKSFRIMLIQSYTGERQINPEGLDIIEPHTFQAIEMAGVGLSLQKVFLSFMFDRPYFYHTRLDADEFFSERTTEVRSFTFTFATEIEKIHFGSRISYYLLENSDETKQYSDTYSSIYSGDGHGLGVSFFFLKYFRKGSLCIDYKPSAHISTKVTHNSFQLSTGSTSNIVESASVIGNYEIFNQLRFIAKYEYKVYPMGYDFFSENEKSHNYLIGLKCIVDSSLSLDVGYYNCNDAYFKYYPNNANNYDQKYILSGLSYNINNYSFYLHLANSHFLSKQRGVTSFFTGLSVKL